MWLVKRNSLQKIRLITAEFKKNLSLYFIENKKLNYHQQKEIFKLLQEAHENNWWLACDCLSSEEEPPLMYIRRFENAQLTLVRMPGRAHHQSQCPFKFIEHKKADLSSKKNSIEWSKEQALNLHYSFDTTLSNEKSTEKEKKQGNVNARVPRIGRLLYSLLTQAKLTQIDNKKLSLSEQFIHLKNATKGYCLAKNIQLFDFLWTFPTQIKLATFKLNTNKNQWPQLIRPYGIFILIVHHFEQENAICFSKNEQIIIPIKGNISLSSGRLSSNSGPFLMIATYSNLPNEPGKFNIINCFAIPTYNRQTIMPIESHYERRVLEKLIQIQQAFAKKEIQLVIEKPLLDIQTKSVLKDTFNSSRPDFILKTSKKIVVLEVMGSTEDTYQIQKEKTHQYMRELGELILFDAVTADKKNEWDIQLNELAKQIYRLLL